MFHKVFDKLAEEDQDKDRPSLTRKKSWHYNWEEDSDRMTPRKRDKFEKAMATKIKARIWNIKF